MLKIFSNHSSFYSFQLLFSGVIFIIGKYLSPFEIKYTFFVSATILIFIILILEKIISGIHKTREIEIRPILFLFLFLSPILQFNLFLHYDKFLSAFFLSFAFLNYFLFEKEFKKTFLLFSFLGIIFSIYFSSYSLIASLPLFLMVILKSGWKRIIYLIAFILLLIFVFYSTDFAYLLSEWSIDNWFKSDFNLIDYTSINIIFAFFPLLHPLIFIPGILILPFIRPSDFEESVVKISLVAFILNALFIAGFPFQNFSMLILTFPLVIIIVFPAILRVIHLTEYFRPVFLKFLPFLIFIIQLSLLCFLLINNDQMFFK